MDRLAVFRLGGESPALEEWNRLKAEHNEPTAPVLRRVLRGQRQTARAWIQLPRDVAGSRLKEEAVELLP